MAVSLASKVYNFKMEPVKNKLVTTFRRRQNESSIADLVTVTGLPKYQVEQAAKVVLDEYGGQCKVTESGEILYYFPRGMRSRVRGFIPGLKRFGRTFLKTAGKVFAFLFKVWIMAMLVGYFVLFLAILVAAMVASIFLSASSRGGDNRRRGRGMGLGGMFLVVRLLELFLQMFFWVNLTRALDPDSPRRKRGRPFYKSVFGFVFGEGDPNADWDSAERIRILSFIRSQKGVVTVEELMALTGRDSEGANLLINSLLVEFEGEPSVTDEGSLYFFFPELLRTRKEELLLTEVATVDETEYKELIPFSANKGGANGAIVFFNTFNLLFGAYFAYFGLQALSGVIAETGFGTLYSFLHITVFGGYLGIPDPALGLFIGLGLVPLVFSLFFFVIPLIRNFRRRARNEKIKRENLRKRLFSSLHFNPVGFNPLAVRPSGEADAAANASSLIRRETERFAAEKKAEVEETDDGTVLYNFRELEREIADVAAFRKTVDLGKYEVGKTVFDTNE